MMMMMMTMMMMNHDDDDDDDGNILGWYKSTNHETKHYNQLYLSRNGD